MNDRRHTERLSLALLAGCALFALAPYERDDTTVSPAPDAAAAPEAHASTDAIARPDPVVAPREIEPRGEMLAESAAVPDPDADLVAQILERFSVRHTALSNHERARLARVILEESRRHGLDPELVMGVIEVESAGYPLAVSHVGALGLMQLLPSTAEEVAGKQGIRWKGPDTLFDPVVNVRLGTAYLRELAERYDGNVNTALAAYNWGPGRIDRRLARGKTLPSLYIEQVRSAVDRYADTGTKRS